MYVIHFHFVPISLECESQQLLPEWSLVGGRLLLEGGGCAGEALIEQFIQSTNSIKYN